MTGKELRNLQESYFEMYNPERIDEAEGSYGQTPKATAAYNALRIKRQNTPASEFRKSGGKETSVRRVSTHLGRSQSSDAGHSGRKSPRPEDYSTRHKMSQKDRDTARQQKDYDDEGLDMYNGPDPKGPKGSLPKGKKLTRQKARGVSAESYDIYDVVLSHLLDEGYAETPEAAEAIMVNMSEEWRQSILG